jgi:hypothetical protein
MDDHHIFAGGPGSSDSVGSSIVTCPFNKLHLVKFTKLHRHVAEKHGHEIHRDGEETDSEDEGLDEPGPRKRYRCPHNDMHFSFREDRDEHLRTCPNRPSDGDGFGDFEDGNVSKPPFRASYAVAPLAGGSVKSSYSALPEMDVALKTRIAEETRLEVDFDELGAEYFFPIVAKYQK